MGTELLDRIGSDLILLKHGYRNKHLAEQQIPTIIDAKVTPLITPESPIASPSGPPLPLATDRHDLASLG